MGVCQSKNQKTQKQKEDKEKNQAKRRKPEELKDSNNHDDTVNDLIKGIIVKQENSIRQDDDVAIAV